MNIDTIRKYFLHSDHLPEGQKRQNPRGIVIFEVVAVALGTAALVGLYMLNAI